MGVKEQVGSEDRKTPVGWLPEDWQCLPFSEVFTRVALPIDVKPNETYREIGIRSHGKGVFFKEEVKGSALGAKRVFRCQPGTLCFNIVFAWEQAVAILGQECKEFIASHRFPMYKAKSFANEEFYLWFFKSKRGKHGLTLASPGGAGRNKTLGQGELDFLYVPVPPLKEQRRIAQVLATWDRAIEQAERLLALKERRKRALMQQLLIGKRRFLEYKKSGNFSVWKWAISEMADVNPRRVLPVSGGSAYVDMASLNPHCSKIQRVTYRPVSTSGSRFQNGDTLFARITPCTENGKTVFVDVLNNGEVAQGSTEFIVLAPKGQVIDPKYLYFICMLPSIRNHAIAAMEGTSGRQRVPNWIFDEIVVSIPNISEQRRIVSFLNCCDHEIDGLRRKLDILMQQKKGLMQQLLTGKIRIKSS